MKTKPKIILSSLICLAFLSASCSSSSNKREELSERAAEIVQGDCASDAGKEVTIYSGRSEYLISPILEAFACETGIDVRVRWGNSTDLAILINEEGKSTEAVSYTHLTLPTKA